MSANPYYKLGKAESLAVLDGHNARDSAATAQDPSDLKRNANETPPVALDLSIRRVRLALLTVVMVAAITALMIFFNRGVEVSRFDARDKNSTQQNKLLDDYNSYSGNISSAFGKPIEIFVAIAVQILVLRFMITSMLKPELSWKVGAVTLALMTAIGYLISNGFNALNVQLRPLAVQPVISAADLAYDSTVNVSRLSTGDTSVDWTKTVSENMPKNPINNTIFRAIVNTRVQKMPPLCNWIASNAAVGRIPDTTMDFGFTQRDWQKRVLQEALEPKQLRLVSNATDKTANKNVKVSDMPMNATLAADLFIYGVQTAAWLFGSYSPGNVFLADMKQINPTASSTRPAFGPTAQLAGLLPPLEKRASETDQRNWLLQKIPPVLMRVFSEVGMPISTSDIATEFSHVEITDTIKFDSITLELEVKPELLSNGTSSGRKTQFLQADNCGPWPALCLMQKAPLSTDSSRITFDPPTQIGALATCTDPNGKEVINTNFTGVLSDFQCANRSKSSLLIVSVGKRLVADSIQQNAAFDATANYAKNGSVVVKNLRKIFSVTVGRLSWKMKDLANEFHATCDTANCDGLDLALAAVDSQSDAAPQVPQQLVVGRGSLPLDSLPLMRNIFNFNPRLLPLVQINELPRIISVKAPVYGAVAGDPLLLHNIKANQWQSKVISNDYANYNSPDTCDTYVEDRLYLTVKNHMYMEYSLQPAYIAGIFYLFQNAVVKDTVKLEAGLMSLKFEKNVQLIAVWASIPDQNAWLTLGGCIVVVLSLGAVLLSSMCKRQQNGSSLAAVTEPHVIARVMLDEAQFPPMVLHRRVIGTDRVETPAPRQLDAFVIDGLSLQHQEDLERATFTGKGSITI